MTDKPTPTDAVALARYKVVPAHESMFHRFAVVAGDGKQQLYLGREVECENMARKFAGAFLDGAFYQANITPSTQAAGSVPAVEREQERIAFKDAHRHLELDEVPDAWGRPMFKHSHVEASWLGWIARASHGQAPADLSPTAGMNIAQRILHVGGRNNDAGYVEFGSIQAVEALVRQVLRDLPAPATADSVQEDAARYRWLREGNDAKHGAAWHVAVNLYGCEWDAAIDAAMNKGATP